MKSDHLLIIRFSAIGEVAMVVPVVSSLARQYPHLRISVLSQPFARPLFDRLAPNVSFMEADLKHEYHGVAGLNALYRRLMAKNFTAIADLHSIMRSGYLRMRFNLDHFRVEHLDLHRQERRRLVSFSQKRLQPLPSVFDDYADVLRRLGYPVKLDFTSLFPDGGNMRLLPEQIGLKQSFRQWIGMSPIARRRGKTYPPTLAEEVIQIMVRRHPSCRIFLFGGSDEWEVFDRWERSYPNCTNASRLLGSLYKELVLMNHLDVMVSTDSANMHLAAIAGTRVVSIWGTTHPYGGFLGWRQSIDDAVQVDLPCRPCSIYGNKSCRMGDYRCLLNIKPIDIADRVEVVLNGDK